MDEPPEAIAPAPKEITGETTLADLEREIRALGLSSIQIRLQQERSQIIWAVSALRSPTYELISAKWTPHRSLAEALGELIRLAEAARKGG